MKGFFRWFKSKTKIKRWILLILVGIILCCYGMADVLTSTQIEFADLAKIILIFIVGFVCIIYSIVAIQKRTLEILVEDTDKRLQDNKANVKSLIFNKKVYNQGPKVVVIGGKKIYGQYYSNCNCIRLWKPKNRVKTSARYITT